jgi:hypothetical protein
MRESKLKKGHEKIGQKQCSHRIIYQGSIFLGAEPIKIIAGRIPFHLKISFTGHYFRRLVKKALESLP